MGREIKPLYRKINWRARNAHRNSPTGEFRYERNTKKMKKFEGNFQTMHSKRQHGYDYTPLYMFLLSKVGEKWDDVYSEAVSRLNDEKPIYHMVDINYEPGNYEIVRISESSYYSMLKVDENGILVKVNPNLKLFKPVFNCCTYTFNGKVFK